METLKQILAYVLYPFVYVSRPDSQFYIGTYFSTAVVALAIYWFVRKRRNLSLRRAGQILFPPRMMLHSSTSLDVKLVFVGIYYLVLQVLLIGSATVVSVGETV